MRRWTNRLRSLSCAVCVIAVLATTLGKSSAADPAAAGPVDFALDVFPILKHRCLGCHGEPAAGSLRLDKKQHAERGGHTGSPILSTDVNTNAILIRVTSDDPSIRMPKDAPALSPAEQQVLRHWVEQGAEWKDVVRQPMLESHASYEFQWRNLQPWDPRDWSDQRFGSLEWWFWRMGGPLTAVLLWIGLCDRGRYWMRTRHPRVQPPRGAVWRWLAVTPRTAQLLALLSLAFIAVWIFHQQQGRAADQEVADLRAQISGLNRRLNPAEAAADGTPPKPLPPRHPPRFGGEYYRGNDERSAKLFNGGFYRTCTFRVWLVDRDGNRLHPGDEADLPSARLQVEIEKAPGTTPVLFAEDIMKNSYLSRLPPGVTVEDPAMQIAGFQPAGTDRWIARLPIRWREESTQVVGEYFLCRGRPPARGGSAADVHYAGEYSIELRQGRIGPASQLWLGCIFRTEKVLVPSEGQIPDDEWFSFRPIPEIVGQQTTDDPKLLGIDAYRDVLSEPAKPSSGQE
ncbi:MAG: c-type cytochrome domain-containing protein [Planctomycetaceae bacterium]